MARESLLQMLENLASRVRSLEFEKRQAAARMEALEREKKQAALTVQGLEREVGELGAVIVLASEKVSEMLKDGASADMSRRQAVDSPVESKRLDRVTESPADPKRETKWRSSSAFRFD